MCIRILISPFHQALIIKELLWRLRWMSCSRMLQSVSSREKERLGGQIHSTFAKRPPRVDIMTPCPKVANIVVAQLRGFQNFDNFCVQWFAGSLFQSGHVNLMGQMPRNNFEKDSQCA
jgi:hypothetical protein